MAKVIITYFSVTGHTKQMAELVAFIVDQPWHFNVNEVLVRPTEQVV